MFSELPHDLKFLILDNESSIAQMVGLLRDFGFSEITEFTDALSALEWVMEEKDLFISSEMVLISNFHTRPIDGLDVLMMFADWGLLDDIPVIMVGTNFRDTEVTFSAELGVYDYLKRPFSGKDLNQKLHTAIQRKRQPSEFDENLKKVKLLMKEEKMQEALDLLSVMEKEVELRASFLVLKGKCERYLGRLQSAEKNFNQAMELNPHFIETYNELGLLCLEGGEIDKALEFLLKALEQSPKNPYRYLFIADLLDNLEFQDQALAVLEKALENDVHHQKIFEKIGNLLFTSQNYEKALEYLKIALIKKSDSISLLNQIGICYKELSLWENAINYYNRAIKLCPDDHRIMYNKALCLVKMNQREQAAKLLQRVVELDPTNMKYQKALLKYG